ncbi:uncharacterized protein LOC121378467 [Gigantopelta aegis]|uniref:uncharacterized protein LOC121378467 n=1 Tax=Gigantopelta aegis TaxID=1735272 RepID=UPI001B88C620|nr:uncharacterized protein LOC121378467 [Gigantopelta aegis]
MNATGHWPMLRLQKWPKTRSHTQTTGRSLRSEFLGKQVIVLADVGGRTLDETVKRAMLYVMTNDVALKYNFTGKEKRAFGEIHLWETVYRAVKRNTQLAACDRQQVASAVSKWLTGARDRNGRRAAREKRYREKRGQKRLFQEDNQPET